MRALSHLISLVFITKGCGSGSGQSLNNWVSGTSMLTCIWHLAHWPFINRQWSWVRYSSVMMTVPSSTECLGVIWLTVIIITPFGMATNLCVESHSIVQRWPRWQIAGDRPDGLFYLPESLSEDRGPDAEAGRGAYPTSGSSVLLSTTFVASRMNWRR